MASDTSPHQNQINALPAPPLQSLEPNYWNWNWNWNWNLPQLTQNTVETSTETIKSLIADESQELDSSGDSSGDSSDDSYGEAYDESYDDSSDASVLESALVLAVALQHALDQLLAPHKMQDVPLEENPKFYGGENLQQDSLLSALSFIYFLLTDDKVG